MKRTALCLILFFACSVNAQTIFTLWSYSADDPENREQTDSTYILNDPLVYNVTRPALTYYPADPSLATGTSVIICPGGSFCYLHIKTEGEDVARWLNKKGVSAFVLKYRLLHSDTEHPMKERMEKAKDTAAARKAVLAVAPLAIADARQAIVYVRTHAKELGLSPERVGILGFSAGGTLATATLFDYTAANRPDFAVPVYAYIPSSFPATAPRDAPPVFIVAASDDELQLVPMSVGLYNKWLAANRSAELHIYSKGGHGFGMNKKNLPSDTWIDRLGDWLQVQDLLKQ